MKRTRQELNLFFNALTFFTRLPAPSWVEFDEHSMQQATRYLTWIGLLLGGILALALISLQQLLPDSIAVILTLVLAMLLTGALHEDGLADCADGFGGGWNKEQILKIMKDSAIGSYGALALGSVIALKWAGLSATADPVIALLLAHTLSRLLTYSHLYTDNYARSDDSSKSAQVVNRISRHELLFASIPVLLLIPFVPITCWLILIPLIALRLWLGSVYRRKLGGYTGDCLGASQQLSETMILVLLSAPLLS